MTGAESIPVPLEAAEVLRRLTQLFGWRFRIKGVESYGGTTDVWAYFGLAADASHVVVTVSPNGSTHLHIKTVAAEKVWLDGRPEWN